MAELYPAEPNNAKWKQNGWTKTELNELKNFQLGLQGSVHAPCAKEPVRCPVQKIFDCLEWLQRYSGFILVSLASYKIRFEKFVYWNRAALDLKKEVLVIVNQIFVLY